jgi:hypothetical protein
MAPRSTRLKILVGTLVLGGAAASLAVLVASPSVAGPARRIVASLTSVLDAERAGDAVFTVETLHGLAAGLPVYRVEEDGRPRAIAHVRSFSALPGGGGEVRVRFAPEVDTSGPWRLHMYEPSRKLGAALEMAVTPEAAARFGAEVATRLERLWSASILPEAEANFPAFVKRIDPTRETEAKQLLASVSSGIMNRLSPLLDDLSRYVAGRLKQKLDLIDKLGLGFKFLTGDEKGIRRKLMPTVEQAGRTWWGYNQERVLAAIGAEITANAQAMRAWAAGELFAAAREELVEPILASQRARLESEGEALLRQAASEFIQSPSGGFRVRFAAMLRTQLLNKKTALLLLERTR